jgi:hypothetical protein
MKKILISQDYLNYSGESNMNILYWPIYQFISR